MMKSRTILTLLLVVAFMGVLHAQNWTHYVRTSGHGCETALIPAVLHDARETHLFGIEVDNDITGRYSSFLFPEQKLYALKAMVDSVHAAKNFVFVYTAGLECITDSVMPDSETFLRNHPDWAQRNKNGNPAVFGYGDAFWINENSEDVWISPYAPEWRDLYMQRIRQIAETGVDGVYIDIPYWMTHFEGWEDSWASFDTYTIAEFKKRTGINAFTDFTPGDWNDPDFIAWVDFRIESMTGFMAEIDKNVKAINTECKTIAEIYPGLGEEVARVGADVYEIYNVVDCIAHEYNVADNSARRQPLDWNEYMIGMYTFRAFAEGKPSWMLSYSWDGEDSISPAQAIENLAMSQVMAGTNPWDAYRFVMSGSNDYNARKRVYAWIEKNEKLIFGARTPIQPVGVYFSPATRNYFGNEWLNSYIGVLNLLFREHFEFEIVTPRTLSTAHADVLLLPDVRCISDKEMNEFEKWLKAGKTLIFTGETGFYSKTCADKAAISSFHRFSSYPNAVKIQGKPEVEFYSFLKENYNQAAWQGFYPEFQNPELNSLLTEIGRTGKCNSLIQVENAPNCVIQTSNVDKKPTVFIANFAGLKSRYNAKQLPLKSCKVRFMNCTRNAKVIVIPYLGESQEVTGNWENGILTVLLPEIQKGAIVQLQ